MSNYETNRLYNIILNEPGISVSCFLLAFVIFDKWIRPIKKLD